MKRHFRIDLTELASDDETKRVTETLMTSASGNTANPDTDRFVAVGAAQDDGKVETAERGRFVAEGDDKIDAVGLDRFVAEGPGDDGKVEGGDRSRFVAVGVQDDGKVETGRYIAVGFGDDKVEDALRDGASGSVRIGGDEYVAISDDKIYD